MNAIIAWKIFKKLRFCHIKKNAYNSEFAENKSILNVENVKLCCHISATMNIQAAIFVIREVYSACGNNVINAILLFVQIVSSLYILNKES